EMGAFVLLTTFLHQKGSIQSETGFEAKAKQHTAGKRQPKRAPHVRRGAGLGRWCYEHSLVLALFALFLVALTLHAYGGVRDYNESQRIHGAAPISLAEFVTTPEFWFQAFQNWQSEFFGLGTFIVLSIVLRQRGSSESKPVKSGSGKQRA